MNGAGPKPGTYEMLDAWRGLAALWVVVFHATEEAFGFFRTPAPGSIYGTALVGYLGVQVFFVISGYCIANAACTNLAREKGWWSFTLARLRRIFPPMWISLLFFAAFKIVASAAAARGWIGSTATPVHDLTEQGFLFYFSNLTLTQIALQQDWLSRVCWTLCYEVAFYLAAALFIVAAEWLRRPRFVLDALHTVTVLTLGGLLVRPEAMPYPFDLWPQFGLGVLVYDWIQSGETRRPRAWAAVIGVQVVAFIALYQMPLGFQANPSREQFITALLLSVLLVVLYRWDARIARATPVRLLGGIGLYSYSLYLMHLLVITVLARLTIAHVPPAWHLPYVLGLSLACVAAARVFYHFFERPFTGARPSPAPALPVLEAAR